MSNTCSETESHFYKPSYLEDVDCDFPSALWVSRSSWSWFCKPTRSTVCLEEILHCYAIFVPKKAVHQCTKGGTIVLVNTPLKRALLIYNLRAALREHIQMPTYTKEISVLQIASNPCDSTLIILLNLLKVACIIYIIYY